MSDANPAALDQYASEEIRKRYLATYDALASTWPVTHDSTDVATRFGSTHVLSSGSADAPALVLLHAFQATALVWRPNVAELSQSFRVHAVDIIGQGGRSVQSRPIRTGGDYAEWLCDLLDALGIRRASLVGNSYGGFLAMNQASLSPERVERIVMINPGGVFTSFVPHVARMLLTNAMVALRLKRRPAGRSIASVLGRNVILRPDEQEWADLASLVTFNKGFRPSAILPRVFSTAELQAIQAPTLLLMGDNELLYDPRKIIDRAKARMPSIETALVSGAHHMAAMSIPGEVNVLLKHFLQGEVKPRDLLRSGTSTQ